MGCCADSGLTESDANGTCTECGQPTLDGVAIEQCEYSPEECNVCHWKPCDQSC